MTTPRYINFEGPGLNTRTNKLSGVKEESKPTSKYIFFRLVVEGARGRGRSRKTWEQCVRDDMKLLGLHPEWDIFRDMWRDLIWGKRLTLA